MAGMRVPGEPADQIARRLASVPNRDRPSSIAWLKQASVLLENSGTFATVAGGAAAGLTGLLFVAVSIRIEVIAKSQELRNRAAQTLALFVTVLLITILLSIPDQSGRVLGIELAAIALITAAAHVILGRRAAADSTEADDTGLDVLVLPVLVALVGGVVSAWLLLTKIPE